MDFEGPIFVLCLHTEEKFENNVNTSNGEYS